jgi:hypothetical protein
MGGRRRLPAQDVARLVVGRSRLSREGPQHQGTSAAVQMPIWLNRSHGFAVPFWKSCPKPSASPPFFFRLRPENGLPARNPKAWRHAWRRPRLRDRRTCRACGDLGPSGPLDWPRIRKPSQAIRKFANTEPPARPVLAGVFAEFARFAEGDRVARYGLFRGFRPSFAKLASWSAVARLELGMGVQRRVP